MEVQYLRRSKNRKTRKKKSISELKIYDDYMFGTVMKNEKCCKIVLETVLGITISKIEYIEEQKDIQEEYDEKGIRLDVYVKDEEGTVYNVEMQQKNKGNLPERSRFYQAQITVNSLPSGKDYSRLNKSFVIFICRFDPFKEKRYVYRFTYREEKNSQLELDDGTVIVFLNTKGKYGEISDELKGLLQYFDGKKPKTDGAKIIQKQVDRCIDEKGRRKKHMTVEDLIIEGRMEGEIKCLIKQVIKKYKKGEKIHQISEELEEDIKVIEDIYNSIDKAGNKEDVDIVYDIYIYDTRVRKKLYTNFH